VIAEKRLGDLISRLTGDVGAVEQLVASGLLSAVFQLASVAVFAVAAFWLNWRLALIALVVAPVFWGLSRFFSSRFAAAARATRVEQAAVTTVVQESLSNATLVQAYNQQAHEVERLDKAGGALMRAQLRGARLSGVYAPLLQFVEVLGTLLVIGLGAWQISTSHLTLGGLLAFVGFLSQLYGPISGLSRIPAGVASAKAGVERLTEILDARASVTEPDDPRAMDRATGRVAFDQVTLTYPGAERPVLQDLSFTLEPGETLAVVGPSGSGKSTVARLLLRFADPDSGSVSLDQVSVDQLSLSTLRANVALLPQNVTLVHGTVSDNIAYGMAEVSPERVREAARAAGADAFITELPDGYRTVVGDHGHQLSGGQALRIALARALVRDAPVLVLDEPTAALDVETARGIIKPLLEAEHRPTIVLITHHLELADRADHVLTLQSASEHATIRRGRSAPTRGRTARPARRDFARKPVGTGDRRSFVRTRLPARRRWRKLWTSPSVR
jgi:ATP-binding cassette subfamily B protein